MNHLKSSSTHLLLLCLLAILSLQAAEPKNTSAI